MKAVLMALVMTIRACSDIQVSRCFPLSISRFWQVRWLNGTMRKHRSRRRQNRPLQVLLHPVLSSRGFFDAIERDGDYGSRAVLKSPRDQPPYLSRWDA
jgi:hypothetical protein